MRMGFAFAILAMATTAWAQQPVTGTVISPAPRDPGSLAATRVIGIDENSCTAKGFLYIAVTGVDEHNSEAIVAKFQLVDPQGRRIGPKMDSEEIISDFPTGSGFDWEALDDDENPDAPPEVPHGVFEICNPLTGTYHLEGKALVSGSYTIEIAASSLETLNARGIPQSTSSHVVFDSKASAGELPVVIFRYDRAQNAKVEFLGKP